MTQAQWDHIQDLKNFQSNLEQEQRRLKEEINSVAERITLNRKEINDICDCKTPDGKSTWEGRYMFSECTICGKNDI